jgi:hypothetical protein
MESPTDPQPRSSVLASLLRQLTRRLDATYDLAATVRELLPGGDPAEIDAATARLETVTQEFKVLVEELRRLPADAAASADEATLDEIDRERAALEASAARLARSSAITGGLLERMVGVSRGLLDLLAIARDGTYRPDGRASDLSPRGVRLQERV